MVPSGEVNQEEEPTAECLASAMKVALLVEEPREAGMEAVLGA